MDLRPYDEEDKEEEKRSDHFLALSILPRMAGGLLRQESQRLSVNVKQRLRLLGSEVRHSLLSLAVEFIPTW